MKSIVISSFLALVAFSLYASNPPASKDTVAPPTTHALTLLSSPTSVGIGDSPLVRAAKATNRLGKKPSQVITNDTLVRTGGHFTTTTPEAQAALPAARVVTGPSPEQLAAEAKKKKADALVSADRTRKAEEVRKNTAALRAARAEGDTPEAIYDDAPALEGPIPTLKPLTPQTMGQPQKPPR